MHSVCGEMVCLYLVGALNVCRCIPCVCASVCVYLPCVKCASVSVCTCTSLALHTCPRVKDSAQVLLELPRLC